MPKSGEDVAPDKESIHNVVDTELCTIHGINLGTGTGTIEYTFLTDIAFEVGCVLHSKLPEHTGPELGERPPGKKADHAPSGVRINGCTEDPCVPVLTAKGCKKVEYTAVRSALGLRTALD